MDHTKKKDSRTLTAHRSEAMSAAGNGFPRKWKKCTLLEAHFPKCGLPTRFTKEEFGKYKRYILGHLSYVLDEMYRDGCVSRAAGPLDPQELVWGGREASLALMAGGKQCELAEVTYEYCLVDGKKVWCKCERYVCSDGSEFEICTAM